ncbi:MAG: hypothetical protein JKY18_12115 [Flavobacteriales bacterium]|nr:hypothetical protein [Flavobacteriales bacterium]
MQDFITTWDLLIGLFYLVVIYVVSLYIRWRNIDKNPIYKYYISGLFVKLFGAIAVCMIYVFYYGGGDTTSYFEGALALNNMLFKHPDVYWSIIAGNLTDENWLAFDVHTGWPPWYMWRDDKTFFVIRFSSFLVFFSGGTFVPTTMLLAWISYSGIWRLYELFCERFGHLSKQLAIAILYMPSVVFWGSGLLKDTITLAATCWFTFAVYKLIITKQQVLFYLLCVVVSSYLLISIKPYIFIALMPGLLIWVSHERISRIKSVFVKIVMVPMILVVAAITISFVFSQVGDSFGSYSDFDQIMEKAEGTRADLIRAQYGANNYDIGVIDPSLGGLLSKAPVAITAALYRPFLWEVNNIVMLLSGLENTFVLGLTFFLFLRYGPIRVFRSIGSNPLLLFAVSFSIFFAFAVGLTTANFGALVRYKIPSIPFFLSSLFILYYYLKSGNQKRYLAS